MTRESKLAYAIVIVGVAIYALIILIASVSSISTLNRLDLTATAAGPIALVLTVYFVTKQLYDTSETRQASLFDSTAGRMLDLDRVFIENPSARPYLYGSEDFSNLPPEDRSRILAIAELHVDFFDTEILRRKTFPSVLRGLPAFEPWIRGIIETSPAVCQILINDRARIEEDQWYGAIHGIYEDCMNTGRAALTPTSTNKKNEGRPHTELAGCKYCSDAGERSCLRGLVADGFSSTFRIGGEAGGAVGVGVCQCLRDASERTGPLGVIDDGPGDTFGAIWGGGCQRRRDAIERASLREPVE
jgi:hypothetical protein